MKCLWVSDEWQPIVIESLKIHGMDVYYMPRTSRDTVDYIFGEDTLKQYVSAYPLEMYLEDVTGMEGEQDFISKFGLEIRDEIRLLVSRRRFAASIPQNRPKEGDLIYVPLVQNFFEITFVEHENESAMFYTLGRGRGANVYVYALKLKQFVFSNEIIETGIPDIDEQIRDEYPRTKITIGAGGSGKYVNDEFVYVGANLASATAQALVYDFVPNTYIEVYRTIGTFSSGTLKGNTSNAQWTINTVDNLLEMNTVFEDIQDNARIEAESDGIIDWTETNPFGGD